MALRKLGIAFKLHTYVYDSNAESIGLQAAEALGVDPNRMLKTLMAEVDGKPVCAVVPSDCEVSMKKLAAVLGAKSAQMMKPADAERLTGFKVGGVSPFGQRKAVLLRLDPAVHDALQRWAADDLRSVNAQIEYVLRDALRKAGRLPADEPPADGTASE